jgi:hypothetical protein
MCPPALGRLPSMDSKSVEKQALGLPAPDRARLAQKLLESLDTLTDAEREKLWLDEAARRAAQLDSGDVELISGNEVAGKARALLR